MDAGRRIRWIAVLFGAATLFLVLRAAQIQVVQHDHWLKRGQAIQRAIRPIPAIRGEFRSADGVVLARSVPNRSLGVDPGMVRDPERLASALDSLGLVERAPFLRRLAEARDAKRRFMWLSRDILAEGDLEVLLSRFHCLATETESKRLYPLGWSASCVVGLVGRDDNGLLGLEAAFDSTLAGQPGGILHINALVDDVFSEDRSRLLESRVISEPVVGRSLVVSLDSRVQQIAAARLREGVERERAAGGFCIVTRPSTGEILAITAWPTPDPDAPDTWREANMRSRMVSDAFEPGSSYKLVAFAAALEAGLLSPGDLFDCMCGRRKVGGGLITDHEPYGVLTAREVLGHSSNIGTGLIAERAGAERFYRMEKALGFGLPTGIALPSEGRGRIPEPEDWSARSLVTQAFGQEVAVTGIQLAMAYGAVANGGRLMKPLLVREIQDEDGRPVTSWKPEVIRQALSAETAATLREMMRFVVTDGTAKKAEIPHFPPAGKTSTAQKWIPDEGGYSNRRYLAGFVGFAPYDDPEVLCLVGIDEPAGDIYGGSVAAPIFHDVVADLIPILGMGAAKEQEGRPPLAEPKPVEAARPVPDLAGLPIPTARHRLRQAGFLPRLLGTGLLVTSTLPAAGQACAPGSVVTLELDSAAAGATEGRPMADLTGLSLRDALVLVASIGGTPRIQGSGWVSSQDPPAGTPFRAGDRCSITLTPDSCRSLKEYQVGDDRADRGPAFDDRDARAPR